MAASDDILVCKLCVSLNRWCAVLMVIDSRFLALAGLADVIHGLVAALPAILILELVQMCLQPLLVLEIVLEEDLLFRLTRDESVLDG